MSSGGSPDVSGVASRLGVPPPKDPYSQPWRYWLLRYLAALAEVCDFQNDPFGKAEAAAAIEALRDDCIDVLNLLSKRPPQRMRRHWWRRHGKP